MTFRSKVLLAQAPLGLALALVAVLAVRISGELGESAEAILKENYRSVLAAERMRDALEALDREALIYLDGRGALDQAAIQRQVERFSDELTVEENNITEEGEGPAAAELHRRWDVYRGHYAALAGLEANAAAAAYFRDLAPDFLAVRDAADRILDLNQDAMLQKSDRAREQAASVGRVMVGASLGALLLGIVLSSWLTNRLVQPVARLRAAAHRIGAGDFGARVPVSGRDELAQLATTFNGMADRLDRYRRSSLGELLLAQQAAQAAIDSLPDPVVVFDANGGILIVNRAAETLLKIGMGSGTGAALTGIEPALRTVVEQARD